MNLVVLSHLEPIVCGKRCHFFNCSLRFFCKQTIVLHNKPKIIAINSLCGSKISWHIPQIALLYRVPDYISAYKIEHTIQLSFYYIHVQHIRHVWQTKLPRM